MRLRIVLADDHSLFRQGIRALLEKIPEVEIIGEAEDGREAVRLCRELSPDIIIMDVTMPELNGLEATRQVLAECPGTKVIAVSMHSSRHFVQEMLKAGALGYLHKTCDFKELNTAITSVCSDQAYISPSIALIVVEGMIKASVGDSRQVSKLTSRESEVLQLLAEGKRAKEVASRLNLSVSTVQTHRRNIMEKLSIRNTSGLIKFAIREGLTSADT